jgi:hypothetical protein
MKRAAAATMILLALAGCGRNPMEPPAGAYLQDFDSQVRILNTTLKAAAWIHDNATYNGWDEGWKGSSSSDRCHDVAYQFWLRNREGKDRGAGGVCSGFAAFFAYCGRMAGRRAGAVAIYSTVGHAIGWIIEPDGAVSIQDNEHFYYRLYANPREFWQEYDGQRSVFTVFFLDDHFNEIPRGQEEQYFR